MNDKIAHQTLTEIQRYFYRTRNRRKCKCGCGKHLSLENYWKHPTIYKKVPEFLRGHNHVGDHQTRQHIARRAARIAQTWERKREARKTVIFGSRYRKLDRRI